MDGTIPSYKVPQLYNAHQLTDTGFFLGLAFVNEGCSERCGTCAFFDLWFAPDICPGVGLYDLMEALF